MAGRFIMAISITAHEGVGGQNAVPLLALLWVKNGDE
jgi:hypothetical protein